MFKFVKNETIYLYFSLKINRLTHNVHVISIVPSKILKCQYYQMHITWLKLI